MHILLVTHSYCPEASAPQRRWQKFVHLLRSQNWTVDVLAPPVAGQPSKSLGPAGEMIHRTPAVPWLPDTRWGRLLQATAHGVLGMVSSLGIPRPDVVVATVPALPNLVAGRVIATLKNRPYVLEMRDAWPDLLNESAVVTGVPAKIITEFITLIQKSAAHVITVTPGFAQILRERGIEPVSVIENLLTTNDVGRVPQRSKPTGELNVLYLGNHGESQNLELIVRAAALARSNNPNIRVRFVGSGTQREKLVAINEQLNRPVEMYPEVPKSQVAAHYQWADTCLVTLRDDWPSFQHTVPSKTYELLATGKHITGVVQGEAAELIRAAGRGDVVSAQAEQIAELWLRLAYSQNFNSGDSQLVTRNPVYANEDVGTAPGFSNLGSALAQTLTETKRGFKYVDRIRKKSGSGSRVRELYANASMAFKTVASHVNDDHTLFITQVLRRLPPRARDFVSQTMRNIGIGGPFDILAAIGMSFNGEQEKVRQQALEALTNREPQRKLVYYADVLINQNDLDTAEYILDRVRPGTPGEREARARLEWFNGHMAEAIDLLDVPQGNEDMFFRLGSEYSSFLGRNPKLPKMAHYRPSQRRVIHVLTNSLPETTSGYAHRSHSILKHLQQAGWQVSATTRLGWPIMTGALTAPHTQVVEGVTYNRQMPNNIVAGFSERIQQQAELLLDEVMIERPALLHTTTHWTNAIVVRAVAEAVGIPWVYEVRGQLADTWASTRGDEARESEYYRLFRAREAEVAKSASWVVTLGEAMKADLIADGVDPERITICGNAIGGEFLQPPGDTRQARIKLGIETDCQYIGTVSSIVPYEGLETVVEATAKLAQDFPKLRLLIVGDGTALPDLKAQAKKLGIDDRVIFTGKVEKELTALYHQALDVFVVPRKDTSVTRRVTPMKSVEASASAKPVIASDLPALAELVHDHETGLLVPASDVDAWVESISSLLHSPETRQRLGNKGRQWALSERTWAANTDKYGYIYDQLIHNSR